MKKSLLLLFTIMLIASSAIAQQQRNRQKIKLFKISYITNALNLTPKEAEKFWPVYNKYSDKIQTLKTTLDRNFHQEIQLAGGLENISEKQAQQLIDDELVYEKQITDNKVKLTQELSKIISAKKIISLKKAERDFNKRILNEYGKRRRQQGQ